MKLISKLIVVVVLAVAFSSCSKEDGATPQASKSISQSSASSELDAIGSDNAVLNARHKKVVGGDDDDHDKGIVGGNDDDHDGGDIKKKKGT
jgi:hypothetical protein